MDKRKQIKEYCRQFKTTGISENIEKLIEEAETNQTGFMDFTISLLKSEADLRHRNELLRRIKTAKLPRYCNLETYDYTSENGIKKSRLNQLRELNWLDQIYNVMLMGPSGTGKTFLAAGLCNDAVEKGYKA